VVLHLKQRSHLRPMFSSVVWINQKGSECVFLLVKQIFMAWAGRKRYTFLRGLGGCIGGLTGGLRTPAGWGGASGRTRGNALGYMLMHGIVLTCPKESEAWRQECTVRGGGGGKFATSK